MCLIRIDKVYDQPLQDEVKAYKIFEVVDGELEFPHFGIEKDEGVGYTHRTPRGVWVVDVCEETLRTPGGGDKYMTGFHAYLNRAEAEACVQFCDARGYVVSEVRLRGITATGSELGNCIVAREMLVPLDD